MRLTVAWCAVAAAVGLACAPAAQAERADYPHAFTQNNMGYCAPYLAQQRTPWDGSPVRPWINHTVQDLIEQYGAFRGYTTLGALYADKARSQDDRACIPQPNPQP